MRNKLLVAVLSLAISAFLSTASFAEDVYVTKYGKRYHKQNSRFIKDKDVEKLTREEAEALGYKPSSEFSKEADSKGKKVAKKSTKKAKK